MVRLGGEYINYKVIVFIIFCIIYWSIKKNKWIMVFYKVGYVKLMIVCVFAWKDYYLLFLRFLILIVMY